MVDPGKIELTFLGTGTSAGVPMIGCHCEVCSSTDARDRRTRPSVVISYGATCVLIDATPELRLQCVANGIDMVDAVIVTHAHADHIMGLDDLRRFNALRKGPLDVWSEAGTHDILSRSFGYAFREPDPAQKVFRPHLVWREIANLQPFQIGEMIWQPIRLFHGHQSIVGFRIGKLAYCTDVSRIPPESMEMLRDLDVLVLDALQYRAHTTHFSLEEAVNVAGILQPKQTLFTHIAHALGHEKVNAELPDNIQLAFDGQRVIAGI